MTIEVIRAIAELWRLALVALFIMIFILYRKQIVSLIEKGQTKLRLKMGSAEASLERESQGEQPKPDALPEEESSRETVHKEVRADVLSTEPTTPSELLEKMRSAASSRDIGEVEKVHEKLQQSETDGLLKLKDEALYYYLRYVCGDATALDKLQNLAKRPEVSSYAHYLTGTAYELAAEFASASRAYEAAMSATQEEEERARMTVHLARSIFKAGQAQQAITIIMDELAKAKTVDAVSELYEGLSALYQLATDPQLRSIALERALEIKPNDTKLRFQAAFGYSDAGLNALSLLHYQSLVKFTPDDTTSQNNLGVQYDRLGMPIRSTGFYRKAAAKNYTLAMSNLAYRYMNAGFTEEAAQILDKAKQIANVHPNVGRAISSLAEKEEEESKTEERFVTAAREHQRFIRAFADAYFLRVPSALSFGGPWRAPDGQEINISQTGDQLEANWSMAYIKRKFSGSLNNRAARVTYYEMTYAFALRTEQGFRQDGHGLLYFSPNGQQLFVMDMREREPSFLTLARVG